MKSNTLRGDEQVQKHALRSLREYVETVRGKRRQTESRPSNQLSSGSESILGGVAETADHQLSGPRPLRQLSNASETIPPVTAEPKEGVERSEWVPSSATNGSHVPEGRGGVFRQAEDMRQGDGVTPVSQHSNRTYSESSGGVPVMVSSQGHSDAPLKATTAPPTGGLAIGGGAAEEEERRISVSGRTRPQNVGGRLSNAFESSKVPVPVSSGQEQKGDVAGGLEGVTLYDDVSTSSQASTALLSDMATPSHMHIAMEASSGSSLGQDMPPQGTGDRVAQDKPPADRQANGKKKTRSKPPKQLKLEFQELTLDNVVKCTLISNTGQVDFRFSTKYDKPGAIFKKLVRKGAREYCIALNLVESLHQAGF